MMPPLPLPLLFFVLLPPLLPLLLKWQEVRQAEKEEREVNENEQRRRSR